MSVRAKRLTESEWPGWAEYMSRADSRLRDLPTRLKATIEHGWAPEPLTPAGLDAWAAEKIMRWRNFAGRWTTNGGHGKFDVADWEPSTDLSQAIECANRAQWRCQLVIDEQGATASCSERWPRYGYFRVYHGEYDAAAIAEAIMRHLHAEIAS